MADIDIVVDLVAPIPQKPLSPFLQSDNPTPVFEVYITSPDPTNNTIHSQPPCLIEE